jgi:hypothetical protein
MKALFFIVAVALCAPSALAQEDFPSQEGSTTVEPELPAPASVAVESRLHEAVALYIATVGPPLRSGRMSMVGARVCAFQDFAVPSGIAHPHAGLVLRIHTGECLEDRNGDVHNFVHDSDRQRIRDMLNERQTLELLALMTQVGGAQESASR